MLVNIGGEKTYHGLAEERVVTILAYKGSGVKRFKREAEKIPGKVLDIRSGKKVKSLILLDTQNVILSPYSSKALMSVFNKTPSSILTTQKMRKATSLRQQTGSVRSEQVAKAS